MAAIKQLNRRDDIVITKPDKGSSIVVMDKSEAELGGRQPKHYHPLLAKEALVQSTITTILPHAAAQSLRPTGSRLVHLYGLPKTNVEEILKIYLFSSFELDDILCV